MLHVQYMSIDDLELTQFPTQFPTHLALGET